MDRLYRWKVKPEAVVAVTGIVSGFSVAAREFCTPKKGVMVQTPVYNEFHAIKNNVGIPQIDVPFHERLEGNILSYEIDWETFERQVKEGGNVSLVQSSQSAGHRFLTQGFVPDGGHLHPK